MKFSLVLRKLNIAASIYLSNAAVCLFFSLELIRKIYLTIFSWKTAGLAVKARAQPRQTMAYLRLATSATADLLFTQKHTQKQIEHTQVIERTRDRTNVVMSIGHVAKTKCWLTILRNLKTLPPQKIISKSWTWIEA